MTNERPQGEGRLSGKVCVITGATGIAEAAAIRFAEEGASLFVASIKADDCLALGEHLGAAPYEWTETDLTDESATERAFARCIDAYGRVDSVFAAVGGSGRPFGDTTLHDLSLDAWRRTLALNLDTSFLTAREATRAMRANDSGGSIVLVSSVAATDPVPNTFDAFGYAAAKGGVNALTVNGASHYSADGIRFNCIAPALTVTPMAGLRALSDPTIGELTKRKMQLSGGGPLEARDHAELAVFLCSAESRHITGQIIRVDAGWGVS